ncbi:unnamed protein product [Diabrotica balteata]|uniref:Sodium channel protein Nach n=1 Tax=Diabrotica balteata TaxID=107213 RepID=A0A9N9X912_DIABA|nr:unnamed protein product [Diabrotica balteata]
MFVEGTTCEMFQPISTNENIGRIMLYIQCICVQKYFNLRIRVSNPYHYADWNAMNILIGTRRVNMVSILPQYTEASEEIRELPLSQRQCLYPDEKDLIYFKVYNFRSCLVECRMNITREMCNCTPHYYLPDNGRDPSIKVCNLLDIPCLAKINGLY